MAYIPLRKAVEFLGLHPNTLRVRFVFSCRMHGLRKYSKKIKEDLSEIESCTEKEN